MSVVAEFALPVEDLALAQTFEAIPDLIVEVEPAVSGPSNGIMPYVWATESNLDATRETLQDDPTTRRVTELDRTEGGTLYRVEWADHVRETVETLLACEPVVLTVSATARGWEFQFRFEHQDDLALLHGALDRAAVRAELKRLHPPETPTVDGQFALTAKQREALSAALDAGYFAVPREATLSDLAGDLDISPQALSKRIRRGHEVMCRQVLTTGPRPVGDRD